jgi:hypothetical protein
MIKYVKKEKEELPIAFWITADFPFYVRASANQATSDVVAVCMRINSKDTTYPEAMQILFEAGFLQRIVTED